MPDAAPVATEVTSPAAPPPAPTADPKATYEERMAALKADPVKIVGVKGEELTEAPAATTPEVKDARAERAARLEALQANERKRVADYEQKRREPETNALKARLAELEAKASKYDALEKDTSTAEGLFDLAQRKQIPPHKMAEFLRDQLTNPEKIAEQQAHKAITASEAKMQAKIEALEAKLAQQSADREAAEMASENIRLAGELIQHTSTSARLAPYSAQFLQSKGAQAYIAFATEIAQHQPQGIGIPALHDAIESSLEAFATVYSVPAPKQAKNLPRAAAQANTTVSNALASGRSAIAEPEQDFAKLPYEERLAILKRP